MIDTQCIKIKKRKNVPMPGCLNAKRNTITNVHSVSRCEGFDDAVMRHLLEDDVLVFLRS